MPAQTLRPYQSQGLANVMERWREGARSILLISPTGSGKTSILAYLIAQLANAGKPSVILVHRRELADQAANRLREFGIRHGYIMAGQPRDPCAPVQIATVQTLIRRKCPPAALVVADEAHLSTAATWQTILENYPQARILGVTATPWRLAGKPLVGAYDASVVVATPRELREQGHLCPYVGFSYKAPDLSGVKTTGGDYNEHQSAEAMGQSVIVDSIVEEYVKHARHLSAVCFAVTVEHSKTLTEKFRAAGVTAEHLDGNTPAEQRRAVLRRVESGATMVLCNVGIAVEGLDIPRLKCCILARPTKSLARAIQMMGRVRRPWNGQTARIHDHAFNLTLHGLPDADRDYTLTARPEAPPSLRLCKECRANYEGASCPVCGAEPAPRELGEREIQTVSDAEKWEFNSEAEQPAPVRSATPTPIRWNNPGREIAGVYTETGTEETEFGKRRFYLIRGEKRDYKLPGTSHLDALMAKVPTGSQVWVTYVSDGRRKTFKVEVDDGQAAA